MEFTGKPKGLFVFRAIWLCVALSGISLMADERVADTRDARFASPQAVWDAYRDALHEGRWKDAFQCLTPEAQERQMHGFVFTAAYLGPTQEKATANKLKAILKNHGLDVQEIEAETKDTENADVSSYLKELNRRVNDREGLFVEGMTVLDPVVPHAKDKDGKRVIARGKLTKINIAEARATGEYIRKLREGEVFDKGGVLQTEVKTAVEFHKIDGRWLVQEGG